MYKRIALRLFTLPALLIMLVGPLLTAPAWAASLQDAKAQGLIGEQSNGYLGLVSANAPSGIKALVKDINTKRRQTYQDIARRNNTALSVVEAMAGEKAIRKTPPGQYIKPPSGRWIRK